MAGYGYKALAGPRVAIFVANPATGRDEFAGWSAPLNIGTDGALELQPQEPEVAERISTLPDATEGSALQSDITPKPQKLSLTVDDVEDEYGAKAVFAAAFSGTVVNFSQAENAAAPCAFTVRGFDRSYHVGYRNLAGGVFHSQFAPATGPATGTATGGTGTTLTLTNAGWTVSDLQGKKILLLAGAGAGQLVSIASNTADTITVAAFSPPPDNTSRFVIAGGTALSAGTDYVLSAADGHFRAMASAAWSLGTTGQPVVGTVSTRAISGAAFQGGTKTAITFALTGEVKDKARGSMGHIYVPKVVAYAAENVPLGSGEYLKVTLTGTLQIPTADDLAALNWHNLRDAGGNSVWGSTTAPTVPYVVIPAEVRATE